MEPTFKLTQTADKAAAYKEFLDGFRPFIEGETDAISIYANASAALKEAFGFFWVGFYIVRGDELRLGPFQGNVACMHIKHGRGVCGTAWAEARTQVVPDVEQFPGHIACSSLSRSEIVVPLFRNGEVIAVLDIDSEELNTFDDIDKQYLEEMCEVIAENIAD